MMAANLVVFSAEAAAYHLPDFQTRWADYSPGLRNLLSLAFEITGADYVQAQRARRAAQKALAQTFADLDAIVTPAAGVGAIAFDTLDLFLLEGGFEQIYTQYWDCTGNPAAAIPMGFTAAALPLSLQISAQPFDEASMLKIADAFQARTDWHLKVPEIAALTSA